MNSAQELKFIVQYARIKQYNLSAKRKQAYPVCGAVEPRGATPSQSIRSREDGTVSRVCT